MKLRGVVERGVVRLVTPAVFFLTRGPRGILGRGLVDILGAAERGEAGEVNGEGRSSRWRPAWVGVGSGVGFMGPDTA